MINYRVAALIYLGLWENRFYNRPQQKEERKNSVVSNKDSKRVSGFKDIFLHQRRLSLVCVEEIDPSTDLRGDSQVVTLCAR